MSRAPYNKRQRTNTIGASAVPQSDQSDRCARAFALVDSLPASIVYDTLKTAIAGSEAIAEIVLEKHARLVAAERAKVIDFDPYSKSAWKVINVTYGSLSGSKQYDASFDAFSSVRDDIKAIREATTANSSYGTKQSALETLRKIGKTIALSTDTIGHEVRKLFQWNTDLEDTMLQIAEGMTEEERAEVLTEEFEAKLKELEELAEGQGIFENLIVVRGVLQGENASDDEGSEEEEEVDEEVGEEEDEEEVGEEEESEQTDGEDE